MTPIRQQASPFLQTPIRPGKGRGLYFSIQLDFDRMNRNHKAFDKNATCFQYKEDYSFGNIVELDIGKPAPIRFFRNNTFVSHDMLKNEQRDVAMPLATMDMFDILMKKNLL